MGKDLTKPCKQCGAVDRYPSSGRCHPCTAARDSAARARLYANSVPCAACGGTDRTPSGHCRPCAARPYADPEYRARHNARRTARLDNDLILRDEYAAISNDRRRALMCDPEYRARKNARDNARRVARMCDPEYHARYNAREAARHAARRRDPEYRAREAARHAARRRDPEYRAREAARRAKKKLDKENTSSKVSEC